MRDGTVYEGNFKNGIMDGRMSVYELDGTKKLNERTQEYVDGTRLNEYEQSISDDLPEQWKSAICL